jgi:hypothetical protein
MFRVEISKFEVFWREASLRALSSLRARQIWVANLLVTFPARVKYHEIENTLRRARFVLKCFGDLSALKNVEESWNLLVLENVFLAKNELSSFYFL